jgi:hypothetical protein
MNINVVIWGLRTTRHSHRYIHEGFYKNFKSLGYQVIWVDDREENQKYLEGRNLVFVVNIASAHIINNPNNYYVTHNLDNPGFTNAENVLRIQVWTNDSRGVEVDSSIALYNQDSRTLYQPWGLPELETAWLNPREGKNPNEYWVGAVWDNSLNQGNQSAIAHYKSSLNDLGIGFHRVGGTRWLTKNGLSARAAYRLVNKSPLGSAIVGDWQRSKGYIPCRLFKNIAAGSIPSSNSDFSALFPGSGIFHENIDNLVQKVSQISFQEKVERVVLAQSNLKPYKYESSIKRIIQLVTAF